MLSTVVPPLVATSRPSDSALDLCRVVVLGELGDPGRHPTGVAKVHLGGELRVVFGVSSLNERVGDLLSVVDQRRGDRAVADALEGVPGRASQAD